eukprot:TRINITY_DN31879_c0_g1_i1.p1 TRINITY_DN31879_c0_g1~~TRINITY_DN31879_c0_g1_i1.p1  ORF type:complete len:276 (+),score=50.40 TRINITY_DN31879_c0_g1_i1:68-895(+)
MFSSSTFGFPRSQPQHYDSSEDPPEWVLKRVDDAMTDHLFKIDEAMTNFRGTISAQQRRVEEMIGQISTLAAQLLQEREKNATRDRDVEHIKIMLSSRDRLAASDPKMAAEANAPAGTASHGISKDEFKDVRLQLDALQNLVSQSLVTKVKKMEQTNEKVLEQSLKSIVVSEKAELATQKLRREIELVDRRMQLQSVNSGLLVFTSSKATEAQRVNTQTVLLRKQQLLNESVIEMAKNLEKSDLSRLYLDARQIEQEVEGGDPIAALLFGRTPAT